MTSVRESSFSILRNCQRIFWQQFNDSLTQYRIHRTSVRESSLAIYRNFPTIFWQQFKDSLMQYSQD